MKFFTLFCVIALLLLSPLGNAENVSIAHGEFKLNANLEKADNWPSATTLLITHGTLSHNNSELIQTLQTLFGEYGISSLAINLSLGIDNRRGPFDCDAIHRHTQEDAAEEISSWANWLTAQGANDIVVMGHSRGGNQTARFASKLANPATSRMILIAPALSDGKNTGQAYQKAHGKILATVLAEAHRVKDSGTPNTLLTHTGFLYCPDAQVAPASFMSYYETTPELSTAKLLKATPLPTLVITGSEDTTVPGIPGALSPLAATGKIKLVTIDGAGHFFRDLYADDLVEQAVDWLNSQH